MAGNYYGWVVPRGLVSRDVVSVGVSWCHVVSCGVCGVMWCQWCHVVSVGVMWCHMVSVVSCGVSGVMVSVYSPFLELFYCLKTLLG